MTRYIVNLPDPLLSRLNEVSETMGLPAAEIVRTAIELHLRFLAYQPPPSAETHGMPVADPIPPPAFIPYAPAGYPTVIYQRPPEPSPLRQRGPQSLPRMSDEEKAAMVERITKGGAEKERG